MVIEQELKLVVWIWDALRSQKEDQTMVVELWTASRARGQKPFPETGPFFWARRIHDGSSHFNSGYKGAETGPFNRPGNLQKKQHVSAVGFLKLVFPRQDIRCQQCQSKNALQLGPHQNREEDHHQNTIPEVGPHLNTFPWRGPI